MGEVIRISVCMPTRNGEKFLAEQLQSILPQLEAGDELVISDDSSSDRTLDFAREFRDSRIRILADQRFFSPIYNMENALRAARHPVLVPVDQDDIWMPEKLSLIRHRMDGRSDRPFLLKADGLIVDARGEPSGETLYQRFSARKGFWKYIYNNCYTGCSMAISRPLLELAVPFPKGIPMYDSWLGLLAELAGEVEFSPEKIVCHRRHGGNASYHRNRPIQQIGWRMALVFHLAHRLLERSLDKRRRGQDK